MVRNHLRNYWRSSQYRTSRFQPPGDGDFAPVPDARADFQKVNARLNAGQILSQLPDVEAQLPRAVYLAGLSQAEAAQRLSLSASEVSLRLRRALAMARRIARTMEQEPTTAEAPPSEQPQASPQLSVEMRLVLRATIEYAADSGTLEVAWQLPWCLADFHHQRGYWHDWTVTQELGLSAAGRLGDPAALARCHQYLGYAHVRIHSGQDDGAHLAQALRLYRQLGDEAGQASTHAMMAIAAEQQSSCRDGLSHARKAARLRRRLGQTGPLANSLNMLGWFYALLGEFDRTIPYCEEALQLHRQLGNGNGEAATWDSLGYAHLHSGRLAEAVRCYEQAVELNERLGDRYQLAVNLAHLADAHEAVGTYGAALAARQRALAILIELDHPDAAGLREKLDAMARNVNGTAG